MASNLWYLKQCKLFEELTPKQAARLEAGALVRTFKRRALVYAPGEPGQNVLLLAGGRVKIKHLTPDGKETILAFVEQGELFGELALVDGAPRREFAEAVVDSRVLAIPCEDLLWLMEQRPELTLAVTRVVGQRRRQIETRLRNVLFLSSRERLVHLLLELAEEHGEWRGQRCEIRLPLSHQEMAGLIGLTRETVTTTLGQLQREKRIQVDRRHITVLDYHCLARETGAADGAFGAPPAAHRPGTGSRGGPGR